MLTFLTNWAESTWGILVDSASFFLLGLVLAGIVWLVLNERNIGRLLGTGRRQAVFRAALIGVPLPLCSCSVLPVASQLHQSGLSRGGTVSFLISTPETGVDSIALTYTLTDPLLTVARPLTAFLTAITAGLIEDAVGSEAVTPRLLPVTQSVACADGCCCGADAEPVAREQSVTGRFGAALKHSFTTLIGDLAPYLLVGYVLAGLVAVLLGGRIEALADSAVGGALSYAGALLLGIPLYICATSSTPLAAVLLAGGFAPGAIMVFLMVGPATNIASLAVLKRILGLPATLRYVAVIAAMSILCGLVVDWLYDYWQIAVDYRVGEMSHGAGWLHIPAALVLSGLILWHGLPALWRKFRKLLLPAAR
ncbi:MAG: SO_0444 family Cu/Zn efflux transporter [candidate division Zixibacteria bacterium]|nr:SO_0444 family Cu/Zn efflux transporter [candidate division Zixibacteria bacterium]